jgi:asparagine synthase (glutamine-hydrolysing)
MCGIAGIVNNVESLTAVRDMTAALRHRGPDGEGFSCDLGIALGHRRLSILDLSSAGAQPMRSRDGRFTISFNGEIFNYRELRAE